MGTLAVIVNKENADEVEEILIVSKCDYQKVESDFFSETLFLVKDEIKRCINLIEECLLNGAKSVKYHKSNDKKCGIDVFLS
ncbi:MAG: hypothetical protein ACQESA_01380 [Patescibacteria group bacterium]